VKRRVTAKSRQPLPVNQVPQRLALRATRVFGATLALVARRGFATSLIAAMLAFAASASSAASLRFEETLSFGETQPLAARPAIAA
jgi:hypothetical protein